MNVTETSQRLMIGMTPQEIENALRKAQGSRGVSKSQKFASQAKGKKKASQGLVVAINKNTRPLNSYMAFRSYYSTLFSSVQQKEISGFVTYMWQADPFKALWTVLAKAYSAIRDAQGKANAPLDQFLAMNAPFVGIIEPERYLKALGWNFVLEANGEIMIQRGETDFDDSALSSSVSVNSVIYYCHMEGYCTGNVQDVLLKNDETTVMINKEEIAKKSNNDTSANPNTQNNNPAPATDWTAQPSVQQNNASQTHNQPQISLSMAPENAATQQESSTSVLTQNTLLTTSDADATMALSPSSEALLPSDFMLPSGQFALDEAFDPMLYEEQDVFDPFQGNQFDTFDWMDGWDAYMKSDVYMESDA